MFAEGTGSHLEVPEALAHRQVFKNRKKSEGLQTQESCLRVTPRVEVQGLWRQVAQVNSFIIFSLWISFYLPKPIFLICDIEIMIVP